jgi:hypothetical protein
MTRRSWIILIVVLALMGGTAGLLAQWRTLQRMGKPGLKLTDQPILDSDGGVVGTHSAYLPEKVLDCVSEPVPVTKLELGWLPKDTTYGRRLYKAPDGFQAMISVVVMGTDRTSIHKPQYCLTGQGWRIDQSEQTSVRIERPHAYDLPVMKLTATHPGQRPSGEGPLRGIYVYWFVADQALTADHVERMWWMARELITTGVLQRWAYVSCFAVCRPGQEEAASARVNQLLSAAVPEFQIATGAPAGLIQEGARTPSSAR